MQKLHEIFVHLMCVTVLLFLLRYGIEMLEYTTTLSAALQIDMRVVYASAPVAALVMLAFAILDPLDKYIQKKNAHVK